MSKKELSKELTTQRRTNVSHSDKSNYWKGDVTTSSMKIDVTVNSISGLFSKGDRLKYMKEKV